MAETALIKHCANNSCCCGYDLILYYFFHSLENKLKVYLLFFFIFPNMELLNYVLEVPFSVYSENSVTF